MLIRLKLELDKIEFVDYKSMTRDVEEDIIFFCEKCEVDYYDGIVTGDRYDIPDLLYLLSCKYCIFIMKGTD